MLQNIRKSWKTWEQETNKIEAETSSKHVFLFCFIYQVKSLVWAISAPGNSSTAMLSTWSE